MAFQPIVDAEEHRVYAYEALVRGTNREPAHSILSQVGGENIYAFDQKCRVRAIEMASALGMPDLDASVSINFLPGAVYRPETCIRATLEAAARVNFPLNRIIFEVTENEQVRDPRHLKDIFQEYRKHGLATAIDDFGSGHSGLQLLEEFHPDVLKLDRCIIDHVDRKRSAQLVVAATLEVCETLGTKVIAEGIERQEEASVLRDLGVRYMQGYLFAHPGFETLTEPSYPAFMAA
jgi:EAL domain-containing protein (putative c-di-GMP-specific phosphodiesterase class I)